LAERALLVDGQFRKIAMSRNYTSGMETRVLPSRRRWVAATTLAAAFMLVGPTALTHAAPMPPPQPPVQDIDGQNARNHRHQEPAPPPPSPESPPAAQP